MQVKPTLRAIGIAKLVLHRCKLTFRHTTTQLHKYRCVLDAKKTPHHRPTKQRFPCCLGLRRHRVVHIQVTKLSTDHLTTFLQLVKYSTRQPSQRRSLPCRREALLVPSAHVAPSDLP